jgi:hypothetical protein
MAIGIGRREFITLIGGAAASLFKPLGAPASKYFALKGRA